MTWRRILCAFGRHDYGRWRNRGRHPMAQAFDERKCKRCGHSDTRDGQLKPPKPARKREAALVDATDGRR